MQISQILSVLAVVGAATALPHQRRSGADTPGGMDMPADMPADMPEMPSEITSGPPDMSGSGIPDQPDMPDMKGPSGLNGASSMAAPSSDDSPDITVPPGMNMPPSMNLLPGMILPSGIMSPSPSSPDAPSGTDAPPAFVLPPGMNTTTGIMAPSDNDTNTEIDITIVDIDITIEDDDNSGDNSTCDSCPGPVVDYVVKANDTLTTIANKYQSGICQIAKLNSIADPNYILSGATLKVPTMVCEPDNTSCMAKAGTAVCVTDKPATWTVSKGETFYTIAQKLGLDYHFLMAANPNVEPESLDAGQVINVPICPSKN